MQHLLVLAVLILVMHYRLLMYVMPHTIIQEQKLNIVGRIVHHTDMDMQAEVVMLQKQQIILLVKPMV